MAMAMAILSAPPPGIPSKSLPLAYRVCPPLPDPWALSPAGFQSGRPLTGMSTLLASWPLLRGPPHPTCPSPCFPHAWKYLCFCVYFRIHLPKEHRPPASWSPEKPSPGRCSGALPGWHCGPDDIATWVQRPETGRGWASGGPSGLEGPREEGTGTPQAQPCCGPVFLWPPEPSRESGSPPEGGKVRAPRGPGDLARGPGQRGYPPAGGRSRNPPSSPPRCSRTAPLASPGR